MLSIHLYRPLVMPSRPYGGSSLRYRDGNLLLVFGCLRSSASDLFCFLYVLLQVPPTIIPLVQTHLADVLWFIGLELEADGNKPEQRKLYTSFIQQLMKKKLMGEELLLSRLENDVLQDVVRTTRTHRHDQLNTTLTHARVYASFSSYCCAGPREGRGRLP